MLAFMAWGSSREIGIFLLAAVIPAGDMLIILAAKASTRNAFGTHGITALVMIVSPLLVLSGGAEMIQAFSI